MEGRNCPNCGAVLNADLCKCPYCGTSYFDISSVAINDREPFYLKLKLANPSGKGYAIITAYVIAEPSLDINCGPEITYARIDGKEKRFLTPPQYQLHMSFQSVCKDNQPMLKVEYIDE